MFVRSYSENPETSILLKLMQEKEVALKEAASLLESEKTKQSTEVDLSQYLCESCFFFLQEVKSQLTDSLSDYKRELALKDQNIFELESTLKEMKGAYCLIVLYYRNH